MLITEYCKKCQGEKKYFVFSFVRAIHYSLIQT